MAGFFYYMAMILAGGTLYVSSEPYDVLISMLCHGTIYFCGFVTIGTELCSAEDAPKLVMGVALVAVRAAVFRPFVTGSDGLLIYILLDGTVVRKLLPQSAWTVALPIYYIVAVLLVLLTIRGFFRRNRRQLSESQTHRRRADNPKEWSFRHRLSFFIRNIGGTFK